MKTIIYVLSALLIFSCSQEKKLLRKAALAVEQSDFDKALTNYDQILKKDKDSYFGNAGKGVVLSEYMGKHEQAIPYLEKALEKSPKKTQMKINYDLGKSYHFIGNYSRALYFYSQAIPYNNEDNPDYDAFLSKRIADCKYAMEHPEVKPAEEQWVKNIGNPVNTEMPEYSPVIVKGNLLFTSQRQDNPKEKKNGIDGRYFEKMYIAKAKDGNFSSPERYTLPDYDKNKKFNKTNESVISASADKLFIYRDGKIYEASLNDSTKGADKLNSNINFSSLQNHASVSPDGKTIFFTSENDKGIGGSDIYMSKKTEGGDWSVPELLGFNTLYNEDSPYMNETGTLFFASNGLPGYGGYDIYMSKMEDGKWSAPENLGQPINSPGDDIYFSLQPGKPDGYYASSRTGGMGDMDIYQIHYVFSKVKECTEAQNLMAVEATKDSTNGLVYEIGLKMPEGMEKKVRSYVWTINNTPVMQTVSAFEHKFDAPGTYTVAAKLTVYCDTCTSLIALCSEKIINAGNEVFAAKSDKKETTSPVAKNKGKSKKMHDTQGNEITKAEATAVKSGSELTEEDLKSLNWESKGIYFETNSADIKEETVGALDHNIEILKAQVTLKVTVNGFADSRGPEALNKSLSLKRARAVKAYFVEKGIDSRRIKTQGFGESQLANNCTDDVECTEEEHAANRRVELDLSIGQFKSTITAK